MGSWDRGPGKVWIDKLCVADPLPMPPTSGMYAPVTYKEYEVICCMYDDFWRAMPLMMKFCKPPITPQMAAEHSIMKNPSIGVMGEFCGHPCFRLPFDGEVMAVALKDDGGMTEKMFVLNQLEMRIAGEASMRLNQTKKNKTTKTRGIKCGLKGRRDL